MPTFPLAPFPYPRGAILVALYLCSGWAASYSLSLSPPSFREPFTGVPTNPQPKSFAKLGFLWWQAACWEVAALRWPATCLCKGGNGSRGLGAERKAGKSSGGRAVGKVSQDLFGAACSGPSPLKLIVYCAAWVSGLHHGRIAAVGAPVLQPSRRLLALVTSRT